MRAFDAIRHIRAIHRCETVQVMNGKGGALEGVTGRSGARATGHAGHPLGLDEITMKPGSRFELHEHEGDHILYVLAGVGGITIDGVTHELSTGDSVFVPAEYPHGVTTMPGATEPFRFLAFGVPHHPLSADDRMRLVAPTIAEDVRSLIRAHSPEFRDTAQQIRDEDEIADVGIDSLELLSLATELERTFDVDLDTALLGEARTVGELVRLVETVRRGTPR